MRKGNESGNRYSGYRKTRLGIDEQDSDDFLYELTDAVVAAGVDQLTLHARKARLQGLSPKENRDIPELQYERVYRAQKIP